MGRVRSSAVGSLCVSVDAGGRASVAPQRGTMLHLVALGLLGLVARSAAHVPLCELPYCYCTPAAHPSWTVVNCTVPHHQTLDILENDLPDSTTDVFISGAEAVMFGTNSLSRLKDARHIRVSDSKIVLMRRFAALNLNVVSIYLQVDNCDVLRIEERTFSIIKGPLSVAVRDCQSISVEGAAFSWLLNFNVENADHLDLGPEVFTLDPTADNVAEHGPGMTIELKNLTIRELAARSFGSSAAAVTFDAVEVHAIRATAFSANTYNSISATNSTFHLIEGESFAQNSLINKLNFKECRIKMLSSNALQAAIANLNIYKSRFENIDTGAINTTVANIIILDTKFNFFMEKGFELLSWNKLQMERNSFDDLPSQAIIAPGASIHELIFTENEIETAHPKSLEFIGLAYANSARNIVYKNNYFGRPCNCNVTSWLLDVLDVASAEPFATESYCTVDEFFARCFNVPEQNMNFRKFLDGVCIEESTIKCESFKIKNATEIKNPRFPHKKEQDGVSDRNKKVIGIVIVTCLGCVIIALFITFIKWMRRKGYCVNVKNFLITSNSSCGTLCDRLCICGNNDGLDTARSISQLSVNEYSERHRLNEPRVQEPIQETVLPEMYTPQTAPVCEDKITQTLPEELTKELLENLKKKLEDPENYVEAREMIEHLYEIIKFEENCNTNPPVARNIDENIYELPFQNTAPRVGKNKKKMISVGTRTPSLDKLTPLSPYNRQTALAHEYFEPKDFAVHLYAEIANSDREKKALMNAMPDVVSGQTELRRPVRAKLTNTSVNSSPLKSSSSSSKTCSPQHNSTLSSNKSSASNTSLRMVNRPLPEKPIDPGEGTSFKHG